MIKPAWHIVKNNDSSKIALGISLIFLGALLVLGKQNIYSEDTIQKKMQQKLSQSFEKEPVILSGFKNDRLEESLIPEKIIIASLNIDLAVEEANIIDGYWEVFPDKAGWGSGSGIPGQAGNIVIFAHAKEDLFAPLREIKKDAAIYLFTKNAWYEYEVIEIKEVLPSQTEEIADSEEEILTLYTCSGFADSKRLIVKAKRLIPG